VCEPTITTSAPCSFLGLDDNIGFLRRDTGTGSPPPHLNLEVELQRKLNFTRVTGTSRVRTQDWRKRAGNLSKGTRRRDVCARVRKVRMVEGIEELGAELELVSFCEFELLEQTQVPHLNAWAMEQTRRAIPELPWSRLSKSGWINQEAGCCIKIVIGCRTSKRVPEAIRVNGIVRIHQAVVGGRHAVGCSSLQSNNAVELPIAEPAARKAPSVHKPFALTERQVPDEITDKTAANVQDRVAHFGSVVVGVLRQLCGCQVVAEVSEAVAERIAQIEAEVPRHASAQRDFQTVVVRVSIGRRVFKESVLTRSGANISRTG
jgi:hypothetical protein